MHEVALLSTNTHLIDSKSNFFKKIVAPIIKVLNKKRLENMLNKRNLVTLLIIDKISRIHKDSNTDSLKSTLYTSRVGSK